MSERNFDSVRSDVDAHGHVMSLRIGEVVAELVDLLGATTVAVIGGVNETRAVHQWMGEREPQRQDALRFALQIATMIAKSGDPELARAWFSGSNPHLDDKVPALMLRSEPLQSIQQPMMQAARAFAAR
jgi:hypothetical protein